MHRLTAFVAVLLGLSLHVAAQKANYTVNRDDFGSLQITFTTGNLNINDLTIDGQTYSLLGMDGYLPSTEVGKPNLPTFSQLIEVPLCNGYEVTVADAVYDTLLLHGYPIMPLQPSRSKSDTMKHAMVIDNKLYSTDAYYGVAEALVEHVGVARDRQLARLQFSPVRYNPISGSVIVCRRATVTVKYRGADREATLAMFERYHSPAFNCGAQVINDLYPKAVRTSAPVRYLIVANSMFRGQLDSFVNWKRRKGFLTDIVYTDQPEVGTTTTSIQSYIKSQYNDASASNPAPTYVLLVGDVAQLPAFSAQVTSPSSDHVTDLYYMTWTTGDHIPDCHYGRFSAQNISQLTPQVQKTLMYEQYTFQDPSFLDRAVMVAGVDGGSAGDFGYTHADPAMDYAITNYVNGAHGFANVYYFKNDVSIVPSGVTNVTVSSSASGNSAVVRQYYNLGAGFINYSAHGGSTGWGTPNFGNSHVEQMTNTQKFGLMIGNCCLTNKFEVGTCFGEALLRKGNYCGAVGYIGGSNSTYWSQDFYWAVGIRSSIGPSMSMAYNASNLGVYDRTFHTHGESYSNWCTTQGSMIMQGNMAVENSSSSASMKHYYWEIYHLMGDPSVMPYMTQADTMAVAFSAMIPYGTSSLTVTAVPYAYVAVTDTVTGTLIAAAYASASGTATLSLPADLAVGTYLLAASAQQYRTSFRTIRVIQPSGAYPVVTAITSAPLNAGENVQLTLHIENPGDAIARNISVSLSSSNPKLVLSTTTATLDSLAPGASAEISTVMATAAADATDNSIADIATSTTWTGGTISAANTIRMRLYAPVLTLNFSNATPCLLPNGTLTITATISNSGHAASSVLPFAFSTPTSLLAVTTSASTPFSVAPSANNAVSVVLHADASLPMNITVPVSYSYGSVSGYLPVYIGQDFVETFEGGTTHLSGWVPNVQYPWAIIDSQAVEGTSCMRSAIYMGHGQTSETSLNINVSTADSVSFYYRVSSEQSYDKLHFLIDNVEKFNASGEVDWTRVAYAIGTGSHILTFRYTKDGSVSNGSDCAWIDNISIPAPQNNVNFSQVDLCQGDIRVVGGDTIGLTLGSTAVVSGNTLYEYTVHPVYTVNQVMNACDSLWWNDSLYTSDFYYDQPMTSIYGCDSTVHIEINMGHTVYDTIEAYTQAGNYHWNGETYTESGSYQQQFTAASGCDSIVTLLLTFDHPSNGIDGVDGATLAAWPSPTTGMVHFDHTIDRVDIYDIRGRLIASHVDVSGIDMSALPSGIYLLRMPSLGAVVRISLMASDK